MRIATRRHPLLLVGLLLSTPHLVAQEPVDQATGRHIGVSEALDSLALVETLRTLPGLPSSNRVVVNITFAPSGQLDSVVVRTPDRISPELEPPLLDALRAHARTQPGDTLVRRSTVALGTGSRPSLSAPVMENPRLRNVETVNRAVRNFTQARGDLFRGGSRAATVRIVVRPDGGVEGARIVGSSGSSVVDAEAVRIAGSFRFDPARIEGEATSVVMVLPIVFGR